MLVDLETQLNHLVEVVDAFYLRLGPRNWVFHDSLNVNAIEALLAESSDPESSETRLIELYRGDATNYQIMRIQNRAGWRPRRHQIETALHHYKAGQFDSCVLQLIAVADGFVNDFQPSIRKGLSARAPDDMVAWNSVVGHHLGLSHAMKAFHKTIKARIDTPVYELYRHGIMHGSVVNFNNVIVATKAWNMLFAVDDWAAATVKAAKPADSIKWRDLWPKIRHQAEYKKYKDSFIPRTLGLMDDAFRNDDVVVRATDFLDAWAKKRWALVAPFAPPLGSPSTPVSAKETRETFERYPLTDFQIQQVSYDTASAAEVLIDATVSGVKKRVRFRMELWTLDGNAGMPSEPGVTWRLAVWAPHTYFDQ